MPQKVVGISEIYVSDDANDELVTYSLGSCICVTVYDPIAKVAGMIHYMLPLSKVSPEKAKKTPAMFADTGVTELLRLVFDLGAVKDAATGQDHADLLRHGSPPWVAVP